MLIDILWGAIAGGTALLFAALGETISERAGVINVGTEGTMLSGALAAFVVTVNTGHVWLGVLAGMVAGAGLAGVHAWMVVYRRASQLATGLVILFLALGITSLYGADYVSSNIHGFVSWRVPVLGSIPGIGHAFFDHDPLVYISYLAVPTVWFFLFRTRWGLLIRTAGERPESLRAYGISPTKVRAVAVVLGGALAGVGGAQLSTALALSWSEGMTAGRGFVAVALVIFAAWNPLRVMAGAYLFGAAITLGSELQVHGVRVNQFMLDSLPYLLTLAVLVLLARRQSQAAPEALGQEA
ncbi:MAG TPA: ABC transporter permease [Candidatus Dormibacteraeota bacterium]|jgi:simple sugar transport system permease protein|nr:ABC transporter permease [Candidatus Dormibacteraeota bacterium]